MRRITVPPGWIEACSGTGHWLARRRNKRVPVGLLDWLGGSVLKTIITIISPCGTPTRLISVIVNPRGFSACRYFFIPRPPPLFPCPHFSLVNSSSHGIN
jgi:hypothetical protein